MGCVVVGAVGAVVVGPVPLVAVEPVLAVGCAVEDAVVTFVVVG